MNRLLKLKTLFFAFLILSACSSTTVPISTTRSHRLTIPESFYECNLPDIPAGRLTNTQVAILLIRYEEELQLCRNNMVAIKNVISDNNNNSDRQQRGN